jgi:putative ABC transport system permease protein
LQHKIEPQLFVADPKYRYGDLYIKLNPNDIPHALKLVAATFKKILPQQPYKYAFKNTINLHQYAAEAKWKQIISFAAVLSIFISCIGLFGLTTLATEKRTKEIGVRKVLGASVQSVVQLLSLNFVGLVLSGFAIAAPVAWFFSNQWLQNFPYRIQLSVWFFAGAVGLMIILAAVTISYQSIRAALMNPVKSLRSE